MYIKPYREERALSHCGLLLKSIDVQCNGNITIGKCKKLEIWWNVLVHAPFFGVPRRLGWERPRLEVRRLPSRRTTGDSLSRTPPPLLRSLSSSPPRPVLPFSHAGSGGQSSGAHTESSTAAAGAGVPRAGSLCERLPLPSASHALALIIDPLPAPIRNPLSLPPFPTPGLSISVSRAPFPCTSAAAGSHLASPQPPLRHQNHRIRWCFSAASASAAGRPLAALPAALRPSLSPLEAVHR